MSNTLYILVGMPGKGKDAAMRRLAESANGDLRASISSIATDANSVMPIKNGEFGFDPLPFPVSHEAYCAKVRRAMKNGIKT